MLIFGIIHFVYIWHCSFCPHFKNVYLSKSNNNKDTAIYNSLCTLFFCLESVDQENKQMVKFGDIGNVLYVPNKND